MTVVAIDTLACRLAEDLSLADVGSGGRLPPTCSAEMAPPAAPMAALVDDADVWPSLDSHSARPERVIRHLRGEHLDGPDTVAHSPGNARPQRLRPRSPGLADRVCYGTASVRSAQWAGRRGARLLLDNVSTAERSEDLSASQVQELVADRAGRSRRLAVGRVVVPTVSATAAQRRRCAESGTSRHDRQILGGVAERVAPALGWSTEGSRPLVERAS